MPVPLIIWGLTLGASALLSGCLSKKREEEDVKNRFDRRCGECHQDPKKPTEGFKPLLNKVDDRFMALKVLHDKHTIEAARLTHPLLCEDCHTVWKKFTAPGHLDTTPGADIFFSPHGRAAARQGIIPKYIQDTKTCVTACHLNGQTWENVREEPTACNSCHELPPEEPHFRYFSALGLMDCRSCHGAIIATDGTIENRGNHIDGAVNVINNICTGCHGFPPGPPRVPRHPNRTDCFQCHSTVSNEQDAGGRLVFLDTSRHKDNNLDFYPVPQICTRCHGGGENGAAPLPDAQGRSNNRALGIIHSKHLKSDKAKIDCVACHPPRTSVLDNGHLDGIRDIDFSRGAGSFEAGSVDVNGNPLIASYNPQTKTCLTRCHNPTPLEREISRPSLANITENPTECDACHSLPSQQPHSRYFDLLRLLRTDCYHCHTTMAADGTIVRPEGHIIVGGITVGTNLVENICTPCHGQPPGPPEVPRHPGRIDCSRCHQTVSSQLLDGYLVFLDPSKHKDGNVTLFPPSEGGCVLCHGDAANNNAAPPPDTQGNSDRVNPAVGAHQQHLHSQKAVITCENCHQPRTSVFDPGHGDGFRDILFGGVAVHDETWANRHNINYRFDPTTLSCTNYCHGATLPGGLLTKPVWTDTSGDPAKCTSCHGMPPTETGSHLPSWTNCSDCHLPAGKLPDGTIIIVRPDLHVNGGVDLE